MPFSVNVQLDSNGSKTVAVNGLKPTDTVDDLMQKLVDKEGLEKDNFTMVFRGKQLSDKTKQLKDLGIKARSNLFVAFQVSGGMAQAWPSEGVPTPSTNDDNGGDVGDGSARKFDQTKAAKVGIKVIKTDCMIGISDGCSKSSVSKLTFAECNHPYCADCVYKYLNMSICSNKKTFMSCSDTGCGAKFDIDATFIAAALTDDEVEKFEKQLNKNALTVTCPNDKCKAYLLIDGVNTNKVQCRKCRGKWFCKLCKKDWPANSGNNYMVCGYDDCGSSAEIFEALQNCHRKDYGCDKNVPSMRVCKKCHSLVEWVSKCKHATCQRSECGYKFCFVCLKEGHSCSLGKACKVVEQKSIY